MTALGRVTIAALTQQVADHLTLKGAATLDVGTTSGTVAAGDDARFAQNASAISAAAAVIAALPSKGYVDAGDQSALAAAIAYTDGRIAAAIPLDTFNFSDARNSAALALI